MAYKKLMDVTMADTKSWDVLPVNVIRFENKKYGTLRYFVSFNLPYLEVRDDILSSKYNSILITYRKRENVNLNNLEVPYRVINGKTKDGIEFYQIQIKFGENCSFTHMLSSTEAHNLTTGYAMLGKKFNVVNKPDDIDEKFDDVVPDVVK